MESRSRSFAPVDNQRRRRVAWAKVGSIGVMVVLIVGIIVAIRNAQPSSDPPLPPPPTPELSDCPRSLGLCIERDVTHVLDGDTLDVEGGLRIRLVLVDAPELTEVGGPEARDFLTDLCLGSRALIDEDDFQIGEDPYGRVLAVVRCRGTNANAAMISSGHAETYLRFCAESEFEDQSWTGCSSPPPPPPGDCDPAYPDVCIAAPPPDLDCADIPYVNFRVLPPDPHRFDADGDGIGCES
jgi:micrococcal nuclease